MNAAFIPVRGGSKSIPLKNIKPICGQPLVYWTVKAACECQHIDKVYVATDSDKIREVVFGIKSGNIGEIDQGLSSKIEVIGRSAESASDTASTESAMLEFAGKYDFDNIVLIQATSPLLKAEDLNRGFELFSEAKVDSVLSAVRQKRFNWALDEEGFAHPSNYDVFKRPRRQEFDGYLVENGAFYITSKADLLKFKNRVSGNIKAVEMDEDSFFEIDEESDWIIIEALMKRKNSDISLEINTENVGGSNIGLYRMIPDKEDDTSGNKGNFSIGSESDCSSVNVEPDHSNVNMKIPEIKMFLTDCDGCLTDGGMYYSEHGDELKKFNTKDGMGFGLLREKGVLTGIVTAESVELNKRRAAKLKLDILETGCRDKASAVKKLCEEHGIALENVCYIGDDLLDVEAIKIVGFGCAPADASKKAKEAAAYVTKAKGGEGVIREVVELIV